LEKPIAVRLDAEAVAAVNRWRKTYDDPPTKSEACRRLIEAQLASLGLWQPDSPDTAKPGKPKRKA
jgi:hypothetical protein